MPLRDGSGKRLSGAAQKKKYGEGPPPMGKAAKAAFAELGPPPLDEPLQILVWGRRVLATTAWLVATDQLDGQRARTLKDIAFGLGATHNRTEIEGRTSKLEAALKERRSTSGIVKVEKGSTIKRPATARGQAPPGPRAIPPDATIDEPTDDHEE